MVVAAQALVPRTEVACPLGREDRRGEELTWGHAVLEPHRGHVRLPVATLAARHDAISLAVCGALLTGDIAGEFPRCSACLAALAEQDSHRVSDS